MNYVIENTNKNTNWKIGAKVTRISPWEGGYAIFTDTKNPGASIHAHKSEVEKIS
jgi:hypothetical protein